MIRNKFCWPSHHAKMRLLASSSSPRTTGTGWWMHSWRKDTKCISQTLWSSSIKTISTMLSGRPRCCGSGSCRRLHLSERRSTDPRLAAQTKASRKAQDFAHHQFAEHHFRNNGFRLKTNDVKALNSDRVAPLLDQDEDLALAGKISKESTGFLTRQIKAVENAIEARMELREPYKNILTLRGVGKTLGLTIMLEAGPISLFAQVGNY